MFIFRQNIAVGKDSLHCLENYFYNMQEEDVFLVYFENLIQKIW